MKMSYFFSLLLTLVVGMLSAQTPWAIQHSRNDAPLKTYEVSKSEDGSVALAGISLRNLWIGSSVLWSVDEEAPIESPGVNGSLIYTVYEHDRFGFPLWGNISLNDNGEIETPDEGVSLGAYPWYELSSNGTFTLILHGGVGYRRYTGAEDIDLTEIKLTAGLEAAINTGGGLPTTLSVAPVYLLGQGDLPNTSALEITGILPIGNGLGFMAEGTFPFDDDATTNGLFRLGILVNGRL